MRRIVHSFVFVGLSIFSAFIADARSQSALAPRWEIFANCAAAYQANWRLRLSDPNRSRDMSTMIHDQSEEYKNVAIGFYENELKVLPSEARRNVDAYVTTNLDRFIAMEKTGTLEAYIEQCPPN
jgi:hypothetical protein